MDILVLFLIWGKTSSLSSISMILAIGFSKVLMIKLRKFPLHLVYWVFLSWRTLHFAECFFYVQWYHVAFVLYSIDVPYCINWFCMLKQPYISGINPTWSWYIILFTWIQLECFIENFWICVCKRYWSVVFFFLVMSLFWYQSNIGL